MSSYDSNAKLGQIKRFTGISTENDLRDPNAAMKIFISHHFQTTRSVVQEKIGLELTAKTVPKTIFMNVII